MNGSRATGPQQGAAAPVAVIGAGWAGSAAAWELSRRGASVTVYEQARAPGGRARRVIVDGVALDNGQHLLVGAYRASLRLIDAVHRATLRAADRPYTRLPLALQPWGRQPGALQLTAWRAPAPLHLAGALIGARGMRLRTRIALGRGLRRLLRNPEAVPAAATVASWFGEMPKEAFEGLLAPLCVSALNTLPEEASARVFGHVLAATLGGARGNSDFIVPAVDLTALLPEPALREVVAHGGELRLGTAARVTAAGPDGVEVEANGQTRTYAAAILAVGPHQLEDALGRALAARPPCRDALAATAGFSYEPIVTVYLAFAGPVHTQAPILRLDDRPGQWLFARRTNPASLRPLGATSLLAVVISARGVHRRLAREELAAAVAAQLRRLEPGLPALAWSHVITERRATYACRPELSRPAASPLLPGLYLAGDYLDPGLPATLESAVRSGLAGAAALRAWLAAQPWAARDAG